MRILRLSDPLNEQNTDINWNLNYMNEEKNRYTDRKWGRGVLGSLKKGLLADGRRSRQSHAGLPYNVTGIHLTRSSNRGYGLYYGVPTNSAQYHVVYGLSTPQQSSSGYEPASSWIRILPRKAIAACLCLLSILHPRACRTRTRSLPSRFGTLL